MTVSESQAAVSRVATYTETFRGPKLSGGYTVDCNAEGGLFHVKEASHIESGRLPLGFLPYGPHSRHSASAINTPNNRSCSPRGQFIPQYS